MSLWSNIKEFFTRKTKVEVSKEVQSVQDVPVLRPIKRVVIVPKTANAPEKLEPLKTVNDKVDAKVDDIEKTTKKILDTIDNIVTKTEKTSSTKNTDAKVNVGSKTPTSKWLCKKGEKAKLVVLSEVQSYLDKGFSLGKTCK